MRKNRHTLVSMWIIGVMLASGLGWAAPVAAQSASGEPDLPAMVLRTWDIAEAGFDEELYPYGGQCGGVEQLATYLGVRSNLLKEETIEAFSDAGLLTTCLQAYAELDDPTSPDRKLLSIIASSVSHYASKKGARTAFGILAGTDDNPYAQYIPEGEDYSRHSHAHLLKLAESNGEYLELELTFLIDNMIGTVSLRNYSDEAPEYTDDLETLADLLTEKIAAALDGESPGFGPLVVKVEAEALLPPANYSYHLFDGETEPFASETPEIFEQRSDNYGDASFVMTSTQAIPASATGMKDGVLMGVQLVQLEDEDAASSWIADYLELRQADTTVFDLLVRENVPTYGDESIALLWGEEGGASDRIVGRVGDVVFNVGFSGVRTPRGGAGLVAEAQVECLENGECDSPLLLTDIFADPDAVKDDDTDEAETPDADTETEDDEDSAAGTTFESELYPYTLTYDDSWSLDDPTIAGDTEILSITNGTSSVVLVAGTTHAGDVESCLDAAIDYIEDNDENSDVETLLDDDGDPVEEYDDERAFTALSYSTANDVELIVYLECRVLVPGESTLEFDQYTLATDYEDEVDARDDLLDGLEIE